MAILKKISTQSNWSATTNNRMLFSADDTAKLFYFDHSFPGLSVDSSYWQIIDETGSPTTVSGSLDIVIDNSNLLNELRASSFWTGDFDMNFSYSNFSSASLTTERFVHFGMSSVDIDATTNIDVKLGIGIDSSSSMVIRATVIEDNATTLYSADFAESLGSGSLRIERDGDTVYFYKLSGATWSLLGSYSNAKILSEQDLYLYISSEFATSVSPNDLFSLSLDNIIFDPIASYYGDVTFDFNITEQSSKLYYLISSISDASNIISIRMKSSDNVTDLETATWSAFDTKSNGNFTVGLSDTIARFHMKILTNNYLDSPIINSISTSNSEFITEDSDVSIISPVEGEVFDNILRITWQKPTQQTNVLGKHFYKIEYKNEDLNIDNYVLIDNRIDPQKGLYDWDVSNLDDDDAYKIQVTSFFDTSNVISKTFSTIIFIQDVGDSNYNGTYTHVGFHNGENLYKNDNDRLLYFDGASDWRLNDTIDNESSDYFSDDFF